jgi:hypothetical protein
MSVEHLNQEEVPETPPPPVVTPGQAGVGVFMFA